MKKWLVDLIMGDLNDAASLVKAAISIEPTVSAILRFLGKISPWLAFAAIAIVNHYTHKK